MQTHIKTNRGELLRGIEKDFVRELPDFRPGDTVRVDTKVREGNRTRTQAFEGVVNGLAVLAQITEDDGDLRWSDFLICDPATDTPPNFVDFGVWTRRFHSHDF